MLFSLQLLVKEACSINIVVLFIVLSMSAAACLAYTFQRIGVSGEILEQDFQHHEKEDRSLKVRNAFLSRKRAFSRLFFHMYPVKDKEILLLM